MATSKIGCDGGKNNLNFQETDLIVFFYKIYHASQWHHRSIVLH